MKIVVLDYETSEVIVYTLNDLNKTYKNACEFKMILPDKDDDLYYKVEIILGLMGYNISSTPYMIIDDSEKIFNIRFENIN